jgi:hypothetical protein
MKHRAQILVFQVRSSRVTISLHPLINQQRMMQSVATEDNRLNEVASVNEVPCLITLQKFHGTSPVRLPRGDYREKDRFSCNSCKWKRVNPNV